MPDGLKFELKDARIATWDGENFGIPKFLPSPVDLSTILTIDSSAIGEKVFHFAPITIGSASFTFSWRYLNHAQRRFFFVRPFATPRKPHSKKVQHAIVRKIERMLRKGNQ